MYLQHIDSDGPPTPNVNRSAHPERHHHHFDTYAAIRHRKSVLYVRATHIRARRQFRHVPCRGAGCWSVLPRVDGFYATPASNTMHLPLMSSWHAGKILNWLPATTAAVGSVVPPWSSTVLSTVDCQATALETSERCLLQTPIL